MVVCMKKRKTLVVIILRQAVPFTRIIVLIKTEAPSQHCLSQSSMRMPAFYTRSLQT